jgi:hypothetical protein
MEVVIGILPVPWRQRITGLLDQKHTPVPAKEKYEIGFAILVEA